tara:strand:- start:272 stop:538 length:267 start_codon:yes stop_codon:yes gene_type:complete
MIYCHLLTATTAFTDNRLKNLLKLIICKTMSPFSSVADTSFFRTSLTFALKSVVFSLEEHLFGQGLATCLAGLHLKISLDALHLELTI